MSETFAVEPLTADRFVDYLQQRWRAFVLGEGNVPCGTCRGCCRAGYAIGLSPTEAALIPHTLIEGCAVVMPLPDGACPFLIDERCSIYDKRPVSCRQFDCRDFAIASIRIDVNLGGAPNQSRGVTEINGSIERFHAANGGFAATAVARTASDMVKDGARGVAAAQNAMVLALLEFLPDPEGNRLMETLLGPDEAARGKAMEAVDRMREAERGEAA